MSKVSEVVRILCIGVGIAGLVWAGVLVTHLVHLFAENQRQIEQQLLEKTDSTADEIGDKLELVMQQVHQFRDRLAQVEDRRQVPKLLSQYYQQTPQLASLNVTYVPYEFDGKQRYFSRYFERLSGIERDFNITDYDTGGAEFSWYSRALAEGPMWTEPYFEPLNNVVITTYSVPFYGTKDAVSERPIAVIPSDISLEHLNTDLKKMQVETTGYGMLFSKEGRLISHPIFDLVRKGQTRGSLLHNPDFAFLASLSACFAPESGTRFFRLDGLKGGAQGYAACEKVAHADWTLVTVFSGESLVLDVNDVRRQVLLTLTVALASLLMLIAGVTRSYRLVSIRWQFSALASLLLALGIAGVWWLAMDFYSNEVEGSVPVSNISEREAFIDTYHFQSEAMRLDEPVFIPTGIMVQSMEFKSANNVYLTGYVWQKLSGDQQGGVLMPEAVSASITEAYEGLATDGRRVKGWYFEAQLRQPFDYSKYPFDDKNVWIRLWPTKFYSNTVLVPDLESYDQLTPSFNPGVDSELMLNEWKLLAGEFRYLDHSYKSNFGLAGYQGQGEFPELFYNIRIERYFLSPFVTTLLPVIVIVSLLFAAVVNMSESSMEEFRNHCTALIFTILLAHYSIRERLALAEVVYFEYFYFLLYVVISLLLVVSHFYYRGSSAMVNYGGNKITVMWYWPTLCAVVYVMTLVTYW
ncbi:PDC sensor domain-containing protein [Ferrimonas aestuarii]|uniref:Cache domain-containing protein n=1 Tax=Ferrimonas aestuarii TaxID=2569539 RepID=A0A4U1BPS5_9GAMM|nr:hypothetical protein [Ferrimonas aestuarii]TKB56579.1 hypothetical protein FCL42_05450 [Ferrimonas aestuarii]